MTLNVMALKTTRGAVLTVESDDFLHSLTSTFTPFPVKIRVENNHISPFFVHDARPLPSDGVHHHNLLLVALLQF